LVECRSPKPEVEGSSPSTPAKKAEQYIMKNPIKFIQEVKQEAFKVSWPTGKETMQGALMVFAMAVVMSLFFLLLDQFLKFLLELLLKVSI
jgi:preprotein translocase subunit SecE